MKETAIRFSTESAKRDPSRATTVNAAFLQEIKEDNRQLKSLVDELSGLTFHREVAVNHWDELNRQMSEFVDALAMHFALEEAYGYFENAIDVAFELTNRAEKLRAQHGEIFRRAVELDDRLSELAPHRGVSLDQWLVDFQNLNRDFARHEYDEVKMILSAINDDTGVGD